jgi:hypothetical protein
MPLYLTGDSGSGKTLLIEDRFAPRSVRTVALCAADDAVLRPIAERFGIEVVVDDPAARSRVHKLVTELRKSVPQPRYRAVAQTPQSRNPTPVKSLPEPD